MAKKNQTPTETAEQSPAPKPEQAPAPAPDTKPERAVPRRHSTKEVKSDA